jgi:hypothetical protein
MVRATIDISECEYQAAGDCVGLSRVLSTKESRREDLSDVPGAGAEIAIILEDSPGTVLVVLESVPQRGDGVTAGPIAAAGAPCRARGCGRSCAASREQE